MKVLVWGRVFGDPGDLISAMALCARRLVVEVSLLGGAKQGSVVAPAQCISMSGSRIGDPLKRCFSAAVVPVASSRLHAIPINSRVLELKQDDGALEFEDEEEELSPLTPTSFEIENLLMQVCDETSKVAEVELKVGDFSLRVKREIGKVAQAPKPVTPGPPVLGKTMVESLPSDAIPSAPSTSATSKSTKITKTKLSAAIVKPGFNFGFLEAAADEGLLFITSPKVGLFRKGRTVKGKSGPSLCEEGQVVKKGQIVCYLEQLGTQQPVEADITGEVEKVLSKDGEPVGYGDVLISIRPSFPGIISP